MKEDAKQILQRILDMFKSGEVDDLVLDKPLCKQSFLEKVAETFEIKIKKVSPNNRNYLGCYDLKKNTINLATKDKFVFYHELAHAVFSRIIGHVWNDPSDEFVADLTAQTLHTLVRGRTKNLKRTYMLMEILARDMKKSPHRICADLKEDVKMVIDVLFTPNPIFILSSQKKNSYFFDNQLEAEIYLRVFKLKMKGYSISVISRDSSTPLESSAFRKFINEVSK